MKNRRKLLSEITDISALDIDETMLLEHYAIMYPHKLDFLKKNWKWINNNENFDYKYPRAYLHDNKVVGHMNFIPYKAYKNGEFLSSSWGGDLSVLKAYRGSGLGLRILADYMKLSDLYFSFGNDNSMNLVKKRYNWEEYYDTYMLFFPLLPFKNKKIPAIFRNIGNTILQLGIKQLYSKYSLPAKTISVERVTSENIKHLIVKETELASDTIYPYYDYQQLKWRLLNSPLHENYRIVHFKSLNRHVAINIYEINGLQYLDLMRTPEGLTNSELKSIIASLAIWCINNNIVLIRYYTSNKAIKDYLGEGLKYSVQHPRCCYFSVNRELFDYMKTAKWRWELIDSDFERV